MSVQLLTTDSFDQAVARYAVLVVVFTQAGAHGEPLESLSRGHLDVGFGRVESESEPVLRKMFGLSASDALVIFRERIVLYCEPGLHSADQIQGLLAQIRDLDMDAIRTAIDAEKEAEVALRMRRVCPTARRGRLLDG
jgi:thioredoxin 1